MDYKKTLEDLIDVVVKENASDLHLAEGRYPTIRVSGTLIPLLKKEITTKEAMTGILNSFLTELNKRIFAEKKQVDFALAASRIKARFRGNAYIQQGAIGISLRLIPERVGTLAELNLPPILATFTQRQQGFFLVVGPTGQGKSTTLASLVDMINNERLEHIITIEDPIEYVFTPKKSIIDQREVGTDTPDFHTGLWGVFRQDVDIVMIGEMRDQETIATAVTAAETGHLVFSTLHTNSAAQ